MSKEPKEQKEPRESRQPKEPKEPREPKEAKESKEQREARRRAREKEKQQRAAAEGGATNGDGKPRDGGGEWLELDVDLVADGGDRRGEAHSATAPREKIPKRPSSRADSRPKGHSSAPAPPAVDAQEVLEEIDDDIEDKPRTKAGSSRTKTDPSQQPPKTGSTPARPQSRDQREPRESREPKEPKAHRESRKKERSHRGEGGEETNGDKHHHHKQRGDAVPHPEAVAAKGGNSARAEAPAATVPQDEAPKRPSSRSLTRPKAQPAPAAEVPEEYPTEWPQEKKKHHHQPPVVDDEEEIPEEDFSFHEEIEDEGEEYKPRKVIATASVPSSNNTSSSNMKPTKEPPPPAQPEPKPQKTIVTPIRPQSRDSPKPLSARSPSPGLTTANDATTVASIQEKMQRDKEKVRKASTATADAQKAVAQTGGKGILGNYESSMPKFNLSNSSSSDRAALKRLNDLKERNILSKRGVEKIDIFHQRPQTQHSLFLAGKSLKYANLKSISCQTGEDDQEVGVVTEETWSEDKEGQFPVLTMGKAADKGGEPSQLLPFLRRTLPLFEAAISEAAMSQPQAFMDAGGLAGGDSATASCSARCELPQSFRERIIGTEVCVADVTLCPNWYGADHVVCLNSWQWQARDVPQQSGDSLASFMRPMQSLIGLYALDGGSSAPSSSSSSVRPARCLYSFCRLTSVTVVSGRPHLIVAGAETGSLLVYDLRTKPHAPAAARGPSMGNEEDPNGGGGGAVSSSSPPDDEIEHFKGAIWLGSSFSTDTFAFSTAQKAEREDLLETSFMGGDNWNLVQATQDSTSEGLHSVEVCCIRCSEGVEGDCLIFSLDLSGTVNFWRVLEIASSGHSTVKLAPQGSLSVANPVHNLCQFLDSTYICIHPQQQMQFVVVSASGLLQARRQRGATGVIGDGPKRLELSTSHRFTAGVPQVVEGEEIPSGGIPGLDPQPCSAAFNPFFPGLLLAAYADGDLALYDCALCVPIMQWSAGVPQAPTQSASVAWSRLRPCVFFVKSAHVLDVWDLAESTYAPRMSIDLRDLCRPSKGGGLQQSSTGTCCELYAAARGQLIASHDGVIVVLRLPKTYTAPRDSPPAPFSNDGTSMKALQATDALIKQGAERGAIFPTLAKHARQVTVPPRCQLEVDILSRVLAAAHPFQAWA